MRVIRQTTTMHPGAQESQALRTEREPTGRVNIVIVIEREEKS